MCIGQYSRTELSQLTSRQRRRRASASFAPMMEPPSVVADDAAPCIIFVGLRFIAASAQCSGLWVVRSRADHLCGGVYGWMRSLRSVVASVRCVSRSSIVVPQNATAGGRYSWMVSVGSASSDICLPFWGAF